MDLRIRKYVLYKVRTLDQRRKEYKELLAKKQQIIDASPNPPDGLPTGKGNTSDPTQQKALKLLEIDKRIDVLEKEFERLAKAEEKLQLMGRTIWSVYKETIVHEGNLELKAMEIGVSIRSLFMIRAKILELIAKELGEYINLDELGD